MRIDGNKTVNGQRLKRKHQDTYEKWWLGKYIHEDYLVNGKPVNGKIIKVTYYGNSVYGVVSVTLDNGAEHNVSSGGMRPRRSDLEVFDKPTNPNPGVNE